MSNYLWTGNYEIYGLLLQEVQRMESHHRLEADQYI